MSADMFTKYVAGDAVYRYPAAGDPLPPPGAKVLVLTQGGVCIVNAWADWALAWAPLPKRNREKEGIISAL